MNERETREILAYASALDNRNVTDAMIALWYEIFRDYEYGEVKWALMRHARTSTEYLTPAHLVRIVNQKREEWRMMNPDGVKSRDGWLDLERLADLVVGQARTRRAKNPNERYAVDVMDDYDQKELEA